MLSSSRRFDSDASFNNPWSRLISNADLRIYWLSYSTVFCLSVSCFAVYSSYLCLCWCSSSASSNFACISSSLWTLSTVDVRDSTSSSSLVAWRSCIALFSSLSLAVSWSMTAALPAYWLFKLNIVAWRPLLSYCNSSNASSFFSSNLSVLSSFSRSLVCCTCNDVISCSLSLPATNSWNSLLR